MKLRRNFDNKLKEREFSHLTQSIEYLDAQRKSLKRELEELLRPVNILIQKQFKAKNHKEYKKIREEIEKYYTDNNWENLKKEELLKNRLNQCNIEIMLYHRRDLVNTYLVINSSLLDAYNVLFSLPENSQKTKEIEDLITELENGLFKIKNNLQNEGVSVEEALNYNSKYEK
jgi:Zn-dependent M32 family carboxypeptidase